jgi:toxin YoeB
MARRIVWTRRAQNDRQQILHYWKVRNKSVTCSRKLNQLFKNAIILLKKHPEIGRNTDQRNVRVKIVRDYMIFYELNKNDLIILTIWDSRNDPDKLNVTV